MIDNENTPQPLAEIPIGPSEFDQFMDRNQKRLIFLAILIILAGAAIIVHKNVKEEAEKQAAAALVLTYDEVTGRYDVEALEAIKTEHAGTPAVKTAGYLIAEALWQEGKTEESMKAFEDFISQNPSGELHDKALLALAGNCHVSGEKEKALDHYRAVLETGNPAYSPLALINMGDIYRGMGDLEKARQCYERVVKEYPDSSFYYIPVNNEPKSPVTSRLDLLGVEEPELKLAPAGSSLIPGATPGVLPAIPSVPMELPAAKEEAAE